MSSLNRFLSQHMIYAPLHQSTVKLHEKIFPFPVIIFFTLSSFGEILIWEFLIVVHNGVMSVVFRLHLCAYKIIFLKSIYFKSINGHNNLLQDTVYLITLMMSQQA